jgi:CheY-like chemotaxis protein
MPKQSEILLVEDDPNDVELAMHSLRSGKLGNRIRIARDGEEALELLFGKGSSPGSPPYLPQLILLDLKLPKVDGLQVLKRIKNDPRTKIIPVVILTSSWEEEDLINGYQLGVNSYIQKPVDFDQFRQIVKQLGLYWLVVNEPPPLAANSQRNHDQND